jgi:hypothetical protein
MTDNTTSGGTPGRGRIRAGDEDRDQTVERLRSHHAAGRLDAAEFNERMETALGARYLDELPPLLADLPGEGRSTPPFPEGPPWRDRGRDHHDRRDWRGRDGYWARPWPWVPVVPILFLFAVVGSVAAIAHGHFPFPLLWIGLLLLWLRPWGPRGWFRGWLPRRR